MKILLLFLVSFSAWATEYHHLPITPTIVPQPEVTFVEQESSCVAGALSQIDADYATRQNQAGVGFITQGDCHAIGFGFSKRIDNVLYKFSVGHDNTDNDDALGAGINWRF